MVLQYILRMVRSGWKLIFICGLIAVAIALILSLNTLPLYRTETSFIISPSPNLPSSRDAVSALAALDTLKIFSTYGDVIISERVYESALKDINLTTADLKDYRRSTALRPDSIILVLTVEGPDPTTASNLANLIGKKGIEFINAYYEVFQINILDPATVPAAPFTPQPIRMGLIAGGIGLLAGLILAIFREQIRTPLTAFLQRTIIDQQSGAFTHKHFARLLEREALTDITQVFSMALIELEGFRDLVDILPDFAINEILHQVTELLRNQLRGNDIIGRWDKFTFAILLPGTPKEPAKKTMERVRTVLAHSMKFGANKEESVDLLPAYGLTTRGGDESLDEMIEKSQSELKKVTDSTYEPFMDNQDGKKGQ
jgi:diguanylate cyclase (GGDEF)-like protein